MRIGFVQKLIDKLRGKKKADPLVFKDLEEKTCNLENQIKILQYLFNFYIDIKQFPKASGILRDIQLEVFGIFKTYKKICDEHSLVYWLSSGSVLGAVRHKGFIPWDHDMDICMIREDYIKVIPLLQRAFEGTEYYVRECLYNHMQLRIERKDSNDVGIDIFPIDKYFKSNIQGEEEIITQKIISANKNLKDLIFIDGKWDTDIVKIRKAIYKITQEYILQNNNPSNDKPALFFAIDYPSYEDHHKEVSWIMKYEMVFPLQKLEFEGILLPCPSNYDAYLRNLYGDYEKLPKILKYII